MQRLKDAFIKAGIIPKESPKVAPKEAPKKRRDEVVRKSRPPKEEFEQYHEHQIRTECELCRNHTPDVEYYRHNNKLIEKRWLCIKCADEYKISDELRETAQSFYARTGRFRRMWGKTKELK